MWCGRFEPRDGTSSLGMLQAILSFQFGGDLAALPERLDQYRVLVRDHEISNEPETVAENMKVAVLIKTCPEPLRTQLRLNLGNVGTFDRLNDYVMDFLRARKVWSAGTPNPSNSGATPTEVDYIGWSKGKGKGKSKGNGKEKGKDKGQGKGKGKNKDKGTEETVKFEGECFHCKKTGHCKSECRKY